MKVSLTRGLCAAVFAAGAASAPVAAQTSRSSGWDSPHRPMEPYRNPDGTFKRLKGTVESSNWSGYAVTAGAPYTSASATWVVPNATHDATSSGSEYVFNWVGIGGYVDATLIQLGTESIVTTSGAVSFYAWYETVSRLRRRYSAQR